MYYKLFIYLLTAFNFVLTFAANCNLDSSDAPAPADIVCVIGRILNVFILAGGMMFIAMIVYGALKLSMSLGDPKGYAGAKKHWEYTLIGGFLVLGFVGVLSIVGRLFGITIFDPNALLGKLEDGLNNLMQLTGGDGSGGGSPAPSAPSPPPSTPPPSNPPPHTPI